MQLEKNDVNINSLFSWGTKFELTDAQGKVVTTLYMRLVGDADLNRARVYALRKSAEKRKQLKDPNSDDHFAFLQDKDSLETERLIGLCSLFASKDLAKEAIKVVDIPAPRELKDDATLEQQEAYQKEIDEHPGKVEVAMREYITNKVDAITKEYETKSKDVLYEMYVNYFINELCEVEMLSAFKDMCTYYGTFKDSNYKERFFTSFEEFVNLDGAIKQQFIGAYENLDVNPNELKKLRVATL